MENNFSEDRRGERSWQIQSAIPIHFLTGTQILCLPCEVSPGSRPRLCFSLPKWEDRSPAATSLTRSQKAAPRPCPALPTALQLQHNHVTAGNQPGSDLLKGGAITAQVNSITQECVIVFACIALRERHGTLNYSRANNNNTLGLLAN